MEQEATTFTAVCNTVQRKQPLLWWYLVLCADFTNSSIKCYNVHESSPPLILKFGETIISKDV